MLEINQVEREEKNAPGKQTVCAKALRWELLCYCNRMAAALREGPEASHEVGAGELVGLHEPW